jgi:hypothetical protein
MRDACARHGVPLPAAALQFTLHHPAVTAAVIGARTAEEITVDVSYLKTPIPTLCGRSYTRRARPEPTRIARRIWVTRSFWYLLGHRILHEGRMLHANPRRYAA